MRLPDVDLQVLHSSVKRLAARPGVQREADLKDRGQLDPEATEKGKVHIRL